MRILYLSSDPGIDLVGQSGGSIHIRSLVRALADLGHQVTVVCSAAAREQISDLNLGVAVHRVPLAWWNHALARGLRHANRLAGRPVRGHPDLVRALHNLRFGNKAEAVAREMAPDFIYERYSLWGMAGLRLARRLGAPLVLEVNAPLVYEQQRYRASLTCPPLARWVERRIWQKANLLIAVSESLRSQMRACAVSSERIHVLPNAADPELFDKNGDDKPVRKRFNLDSRFIIGFVGAFRPWHGVDFLLEAFQDLHRADPSTHVLLVGDGPLRPRLEDQVRKTGLQMAVTFAGRITHEEVPNYLAAMDVAVAPYPALDECYYSPIKLFEYMAAGRAVVASRVGQVAEIVEDGVTGLLFQPGDRQGLVDCVKRLRKDASLRNELGRKASAACSEHTWSRNAGRVIGWVEPLLNRNSSPSFLGKQKLASRGMSV
jgi:glycosyltransferase involved in cell wall biosynthesis